MVSVQSPVSLRTSAHTGVAIPRFSRLILELLTGSYPLICEMLPLDRGHFITEFAQNWTTSTPTTMYPTGVIAGKIAPIPRTSVETNYEDWAENAIIIEFPVPHDPEEPEEPTDPNTPEEPTTPEPIKIPGLPLYIPSYPQTDVPSLPSQEEVQNPQSIEVPDPDPCVNPDPDPVLALILRWTLIRL